MAINFPNFLAASLVKPDYSGISDAVSNYYAGNDMADDALIKKIKLKFVEPQLKSDLQSSKLKNIYQELINNIKAKFAEPQAEADLQSSKLKNIYQQLVNQFTPEDYRSQFAERKALSDMRNLGINGYGGRAGVTAMQQLLLQNQLKRDNPEFTDAQAFEAAGNLVKGNQTMNDGTPFKVSGLTQLTAAKSVLQGTTSALATQNTKAAQSESELQVLEKYAQKGLAPYGDTFSGYSPKQILDTFKNDNESQKQLGRFIASQALQFEIAQNRNRLAMGQPGVTSTQELMKMSEQILKSRYPKLTYAARKEATNYLDNALKEGLRARQQVGILSSGLMGGVKNNLGSGKTRLRYNPSTGDFE